MFLTKCLANVLAITILLIHCTRVITAAVKMRLNKFQFIVLKVQVKSSFQKYDNTKSDNRKMAFKSL
jgi:hypothetical protein